MHINTSIMSPQEIGPSFRKQSNLTGICQPLREDHREIHHIRLAIRKNSALLHYCRGIKENNKVECMPLKKIQMFFML